MLVWPESKREANEGFPQWGGGGCVTVVDEGNFNSVQCWAPSSREGRGWGSCPPFFCGGSFLSSRCPGWRRSGLSWRARDIGKNHFKCQEKKKHWTTPCLWDSPGKSQRVWSCGKYPKLEGVNWGTGSLLLVLFHRIQNMKGQQEIRTVPSGAETVVSKLGCILQYSGEI